MQKHIKNYIQNSQQEDNPVTFNSSKHLLTFAQWHQANGNGVMNATDLDLPVFMETNRRAPFKEGFIRGYHIQEIESDFNGIGKYMNRDSYANIDYDGKIEAWPLTMLYLNKPITE